MCEFDKIVVYVKIVNQGTGYESLPQETDVIKFVGEKSSEFIDVKLFDVKFVTVIIGITIFGLVRGRDEQSSIWTKYSG